MTLMKTTVLASIAWCGFGWHRVCSIGPRRHELRGRHLKTLCQQATRRLHAHLPRTGLRKLSATCKSALDTTGGGRGKALGKGKAKGKTG